MRLTQLRPLLTLARDLTEPSEPNEEYIRGQANLICDYAGIGQEYNAVVISCIRQEMDVRTAVHEILESLR